MRRSAELGLLNTLSYFVLTWDLRTVAQANFFWAAVSNLFIALLSFTILKRVAESKSYYDMAAYAVGGTLGTMIGIQSSLWVLHK